MDSSHAPSSYTPKSSLQNQPPVETTKVTAVEDVQLDKMHPIISDAAMSEVVTAPTVNIISPSPIAITTTTTFEPPQTTSSYEPHPLETTMVTTEGSTSSSAINEPINTVTGNCHDDVM